MDNTQIVEEVDIEEYAKSGRVVPVARRYRIRIDKEQRVTERPELTGRQILALVAKTPEQFILSQKLRGGHAKTIGPDEVVNLREPGVERFMTLPRDATEGAPDAA
jgi:hypothetical protein